MGVDDYLIDHATFDFDALLASWDWLIDDDMEVQPWLMNCFGDLFFVDEVGVVLWLNISDGELTELAASVDEFFELLEQDENAADWFLMGLVDEIAESGKKLQASQCYGFKLPPLLGGEYEPDNVYVSSVEEYWAFCGALHTQINGLPDGTELDIELPDRGSMS